MQITIRDAEQFLKLLEALIAELTQAQDHFRLVHDLDAAHADFAREFSGSIWMRTMRACVRRRSGSSPDWRLRRGPGSPLPRARPVLTKIPLGRLGESPSVNPDQSANCGRKMLCRPSEPRGMAATLLRHHSSRSVSHDDSHDSHV